MPLSIAFDLRPLDGLTLSDLIDRFPAVPTAIPGMGSASGGVSGSSVGVATLLLGGSVGTSGSAGVSPVDPKKGISARTLGLDSSIAKSNSRPLLGDDEDAPMSPSLGTGEKNYEDLLRRATKGVIGIKDQAILFKYLLQLPANDVMTLQNKVQEAINLKNPMLKSSKSANVMSLVLGEKGPPIVEVSKYSLDFSKQILPINLEGTDKIVLTQKSGKVKFSFILPPKDLRYDVRVLPMQGKIKNGKPPREEIIVGVVCKTTVHASCVIIMEVEGGNRHFFCINVKSEPSMFGVPITDHDMVDDCIFKGMIYKVPSILVKLRHCLYAANGLDEDGIFRVASDETETANTKAKINKGTFNTSNDIHAIAALIKIWFRELPDPIMNDITPEAILQSSEKEETCMKEFETLREPNKSLMLWLLDILCDTAMRESSNKMNARSLAIVVGPNLYHSAESSMLSALESLRLSQQIVSFVFHVLSNRLRYLQTNKCVRA